MFCSETCEVYIYAPGMTSCESTAPLVPRATLLTVVSLVLLSQHTTLAQRPVLPSFIENVPQRPKNIIYIHTSKGGVVLYWVRTSLR
jgi:hypothetical protein